MTNAAGHIARGRSLLAEPADMVMRKLRQLALADWLALAAVVIGLALRLRPLGAASTEYDEGVYWQSLRALSLGHPLFSSVFSSQPPLFLLSVYPFYLLFGQTLAAARLGVACYSLVGLASMYVAGRAIGGRWIGVAALALLAFDPLYLRGSYTLQAEVPAIAFAMASVALAALAARASRDRRRRLAGSAGLALALGLGVKLFDVAAVVPVALYLLAPVGAALVDGASRIRWPGADPVMRALRLALPDLALCAGGALLGLALVFLPFVGRWPALYYQVVQFHLAAAQAFNMGISANVNVILGQTSELPIELLAAGGAAIALARRRWEILPPALWVCAALVLLARQQPLFSHHLVLLAPPLALTAAVSLPAVGDAIMAWAQTGRQMAVSAAVRIGAPVVLTGLILIWGIATAFVPASQAATPPCQDTLVARALAGATQPGDLVVADDQYIAALAGRDVPPQLVDTSLVRIGSGYLTAAQLEAAVRQPNVRAILFCSGRFDLVPGFRAWVAANYALVGSFGQGGALYLKLPHGLAPA
jgi:Dolichyl-phosphate-mannose-protein mannosyltransferase